VSISRTRCSAVTPEHWPSRWEGFQGRTRTRETPAAVAYADRFGCRQAAHLPG
jgi:hypothetical protein